MKTSISPARSVARALVAALLVGALPARATTVGIPDSDSATLLALLFQALKDSAQGGQILAATQQSLETAQYSFAALRSMTEVYQEAAHIIANPGDVFDASKAAFTKTFPELVAISNDVEALRREFSGTSDGSINPFAYQEFLKNSGIAGDKLYNTLIDIDEAVYGLTAEHLETKEKLADLEAANVERRHLLATASLTPQGFVAETAKAAADTAVAAAVSATYLAELVRLRKLEAIQARDQASRSAASMTVQFQRLGTAAGIDPTLDPTRPLTDDPPAEAPGGLQ